MKKAEILQCVANAHNHLAQISVCGDGAIRMGEALMELRVLAQELQTDLEAEEPKQAQGDGA